MRHIPIAVTAYLFNAISTAADKALLTKSFPAPIVYIFYIQLFSLSYLVICLFAPPITLMPFLLASLSTLFWTFGCYLMYEGLKKGDVSRVIPIIGSLVPVFLLLQSFVAQSITMGQAGAVLVLIAGMVVLLLPDIKGRFTRSELLLEIFSALFFAISYVFLRQAYLQANFLSVLGYSRVILIPVLLFVFLYPKTHRLITSSSAGPKINLLSKTGLLFALGQGSGALSELLLTFSISLATPALVNSLQGTQYGFLFLMSLFLSKKYPNIFKDELHSRSLIVKVLGIILIGIGLYLLA